MNATVDGFAIEGEPVLFVATTAASTGYDIHVHYLGDYSNTSSSPSPRLRCDGRR